jgi:hypothetical protein
LTERQAKIAELAALGLSNALIASRLGLTQAVVRADLSEIYRAARCGRSCSDASRRRRKGEAMKKRLAALVTIGLFVTGTAEAGGNPIQGDPIKAKVEAPVFLGSTPACAAFRVQTRLLSVAGNVIGSSMLCVSTATFDDTRATFTVIGMLTLHLPGGRILASATFVEAFSGYPIVTQTISGLVVGGTGIYRDAS